MPPADNSTDLVDSFHEVESIAARGPAGTMLMFDGRLWHGTGANRTTRKRHLRLGYFCRPWVKRRQGEASKWANDDAFMV